MSTILDTSGFSCPQPMLMVKNHLDTIVSGEVHVLIDCEASKENISRMAKQMGWSVKIAEKTTGAFMLILMRDNAD